MLAVVQTLVGQAGPVQSQAVPDSQIATGGKMQFDVASIRLAKPGTFTPANFNPDIEDSYSPQGGNLYADFPLVVYINFAYKIMPTPQQTERMLTDLPKWVEAIDISLERASSSPGQLDTASCSKSG
jgi:hypothetical protein